MEQPNFPSRKQKKSAIKEASKLLKSKEINKDSNFYAKESLTLCIEILEESINNPKNEYYIPTKEDELERLSVIYIEQLQPVRKLKTERGRTIAILCIDFLNGEKSNFLNIKL